MRTNRKMWRAVLSTAVHILQNKIEKVVTVAAVLASECRYGAPQVLHSDQGRNFEPEVFQKACSLFSIEKDTHHTIPTTV